MKNVQRLFIFFCLTVIFSYCTITRDLEEGGPPSEDKYDDVGIFVSNSGSDNSGDGTIDNPYGSIQYVLDNIVIEGDTVILRGGIYNEAVRIRVPEISIRSKSDEWAVISLPVNDEDKDVVVIFDVDSDRSKLQRLEIKGGYYYGVMHFSKWEWGDPEDRSGACDTLIENCVIHDTGRDCIKITPGCDGVKIRKCEIFNSGVRYNGNAEGIDCVNGDNIVVQDCHIHDIATNGLYFKGGSKGCVAERLLVQNCGEGGILLGFDTSPEYFDLKENPDYYENIDGTVKNCIVVGTELAGIGMFAALNPKIYNNTIVDTATNGHSSVYFGLTYQDWEPEAGRPPTVNPVIVNNIIYQHEGYSVYIRYSDDLGGMSALSGMPDMNNNCYFFVSGNPSFGDGRPGSYFDGGFVQWQLHVGTESESINLNPQLDDSWHLLTVSPCIDSGKTISSVTVDYDSDSRSGIYDVGADEKK